MDRGRQALAMAAIVMVVVVAIVRLQRPLHRHDAVPTVVPAALPAVVRPAPFQAASGMVMRAHPQKEGSILSRTNAMTKTPPPAEPAHSQAAPLHTAGAADPAAIANEVVVRFRDGDALAAFMRMQKADGVKVIDVMPGLNAVRLRVSSPGDLDRLLEKAPRPAEVSRNYRIYVPAPRPPGPLPAVPPSGYIGFGSASLPWLGITGDHSTWGDGVTVAVLDVGIGRHAALKEANIVRIDLTRGEPGDSPGGNGHATAVASILAGAGQGLDGIAPSSRLLSIKVLSDDGSGDTFTLAKGILEATDRGARIINLCLETSGDSPILREAVEYAGRLGATVVAAVGNGGADAVSCPARYKGVVAVSAVDAAGRHVYFANRGDEVDISAPGLGVNAAWSGETPVSFSGTSAAVPFISGALAALLSREPALRPDEAVELLLRYSDDVGMPGRDAEYGCGIVNIQRVLNRGVKGFRDIAVADHYMSPVPSGATEIPLIVSIQNRGNEPIALVDLSVKTGQKTNVLSFSEVEVGETVGYRFLLDAAEARRPGGINVVSEAAIRGARDDNPGNNSKETKVMHVRSPE